LAPERIRRFANRRYEVDSNQLREGQIAPRLPAMPTHRPTEQSNGRGQSQVPRWLRILVIGRNPKVTLVRAAVLGVVCFIVFKFGVLHIRVEGISMAPNYPDRSAHYVNRLAYLWHGPQRGDVVSIRFSGGLTNAAVGIHQAAKWLAPPHVVLLKRIIGLPGETVAFVNGHAFIDGELLEEPYQKLPCDWNLPPEKLGPDEYFVVGDNRTMPLELHEHGKARRDQIVGKAIL
jgi:signal peptidase I